MMVIGGLLGAAIGVGPGIYVGRWSRTRAAFWFWGIETLILLSGVATAAAGLQIGRDWLFVAGISFVAAGLTTVKYASKRIPNLGG